MGHYEGRGWRGFHHHATLCLAAYGFSPASAKVRAAEAIFNHAAKAIEIEDIEARVSELKRTTGESNQQ